MLCALRAICNCLVITLTQQEGVLDTQFNSQLLYSCNSHLSLHVLQEVQVDDEDVIQQLMEHSNANRSTGSTGANSESSRSHSIMQVSEASIATFH